MVELTDKQQIMFKNWLTDNHIKETGRDFGGTYIITNDDLYFHMFSIEHEIWLNDKKGLFIKENNIII